MRKVFSLALALLVLIAGAACAAGAAKTPGTPKTTSALRSQPDSLFSISLSPGVSIPVGDYANYFAGGYGVSLAACYRMPFLPLLYAGVDAGYWYLPLQALTSVSTFSGGARAGLWFDLAPRVGVSGFSMAGYSYSILNNGMGSGGAPYVGGGVDLTCAFVPSLRASLGVSYRYFWDLYSDVVVRVGLSCNFLRADGRPKAKGK